MSEMWDRIVTILGALEIAREESERMIYCEPHREHQIRAAVDQAGAADILTVRASPVCPAGQLLIVDEGALAASEAEFIQSLQRRWGY